MGPTASSWCTGHCPRLELLGGSLSASQATHRGHTIKVSEGGRKRKTLFSCDQAIPNAFSQVWEEESRGPERAFTPVEDPGGGSFPVLLFFPDTRWTSENQQRLRARVRAPGGRPGSGSTSVLTIANTHTHTHTRTTVHTPPHTAPLPRFWDRAVHCSASGLFPEGHHYSRQKGTPACLMSSPAPGERPHQTWISMEYYSGHCSNHKLSYIHYLHDTFPGPPQASLQALLSHTRPTPTNQGEAAQGPLGTLGWLHLVEALWPPGQEHLPATHTTGCLTGGSGASLLTS